MLDPENTEPLPEPTLLSSEVEPPPVKKKFSGALIRQIILGVVLVALILGIWVDMRARGQCDAVAEELMFLLKPMEPLTTNDVKRVVGKPPRNQDFRASQGGMTERYVWHGIFNTYHLQLDYSWNFGKYELDGVRSFSSRRWDDKGTSPAIENTRPEFVEKFAASGVEKELRRRLRKPEGELTTADFRSVNSIRFAGMEIRDLSMLSRLFAVRDLNLSDNKLTDISDLEPLTRLEVLRLHFNRLTNLDPISRHTRLRILDASYNRLTEIRACQNLTALEQLTLKNNHISNLEPVRPLTKLKLLDLNHNHVRDLAPISGLSQLDILRLDGNKIENLKPLAQMKSVEVLYLATNRVSEVTALSGMTQLRRLYLAGNRIENLEPLENLKNLISLDLAGNPVSETDVEKLRELLPRCDIRH